MAAIFTVTLRGAPLQRTYVSHFDFFRSPQQAFFRTNGAGLVTVGNASGPNGPITVRVHAQNAVVRVLDGNFPVPGSVGS